MPTLAERVAAAGGGVAVDSGTPVVPKTTFSKPINPWGSPDSSTVVTPPAAQASATPSIIDRIIQQESGGNPNAVSPKGATGTMQIMPATARDPGYGLPNIFDLARSQGIAVADDSDATLQGLLRNDPLNRAFGTGYFNKMLELNGGDEALALASYNAGPGAVQEHGGVPPFAETQQYVSAIKGMPAPAAPNTEFGTGAPLDAQGAPVASSTAPQSPTYADRVAAVTGGRAVSNPFSEPMPEQPTKAAAPSLMADVWQAVKYGLGGPNTQYGAAKEGTVNYYNAEITRLNERRAGGEAIPRFNSVGLDNMVRDTMRQHGQTPPTTQWDGSAPEPLAPMPDPIAPPTGYMGRTISPILTGIEDAPVMIGGGIVAGGPLPVPASVRLAGAFAAPAITKGLLRGDSGDEITVDAAKAGIAGAATALGLAPANMAVRAALSGGIGALSGPVLDQRAPTYEDAVLGGVFSAIGAIKGGPAANTAKKPSLDEFFPEDAAPNGPPPLPAARQLPAPEQQLMLPDLRGEVIQAADRRGESGPPIPIQPSTKALPAPEAQAALPDLRHEVIPMPAPTPPRALPAPTFKVERGTQLPGGEPVSNVPTALEQGAPITASGALPTSTPLSPEPTTPVGGATQRQAVTPAPATPAPVEQRAAPPQAVGSLLPQWDGRRSSLNNTQITEQQARAIMQELGFGDIELRFSNRMNKDALADYDRHEKLITIYADEPLTIDTLMHEIAHDIQERRHPNQSTLFKNTAAETGRHRADTVALITSLYKRLGGTEAINEPQSRAALQKRAKELGISTTGSVDQLITRVRNTEETRGLPISKPVPAPDISLVELKKKARNLGVSTTGTIDQLKARIHNAKETLAAAPEPVAEPTVPPTAAPEPVAPVAPEPEIPAVYQRMPDGPLNEMAKQGVDGAKREQARRAASKPPVASKPAASKPAPTSKAQADLPLGEAPPLTAAAVDAMPLQAVQRELKARGKKASGVGGVMAARARLKAALNEEAAAAANPSKAVEPSAPRGKSDKSRSDAGSSLNPGELIDAVVKKVRKGRKSVGDKFAERGVEFGTTISSGKARRAEGKAEARDLSQPLAEWIMRPVDAVSDPRSKRFVEETGQDFSHGNYKAGQEMEQIMYDVAAQIPKSERGDMRTAYRVLASGNEADIARLRELRPELTTAVEKTMQYYREKVPEIKEEMRARLLIAYGEGTAMREALETAIASGAKRKLSVEEIQAIAEQRKANPQDLLDLVNEYNKIDSWGIKDYVPNIERGQIRINGRTANGDVVTMGFAVNENMAARKALDRLNRTEFKDVTEVLLEFEHPDSYRRLESVSPKVYQSLKNQFGTEMRKMSTDLNAKLAKQKAAGVLNRTVRVGTTQKFAGPLTKRKGVLEGEADLLEATLAYIPTVNRALSVNKRITEFKRLSNSLPEGDRAIIERYLEDLKGKYYWEDRMADALIKTLPKALGDKLGSSVATKANIGLRTTASFSKLASRPIAGLINTVSGTMKTLTATGWDAKYMRAAHAFSKTPEGMAILEAERGKVGVGVSTDDLARTTGRSSFMTARKALSNRVWDVGAKELFNFVDSTTLRGMQSFAERPLRENGLLANYLYLRDRFPDLSDSELRFEAVKATRTQQVIYDLGNLPRAMRFSPSLKTALQFKQYLVGELSFLRGLSNRDRLAYLAAGAVVAGPSYYVAMAKSIPLIANLIDWTDAEEFMNAELGWLYRGAAGAAGMDVTSAFSPQLPTEWKDMAGPAFSDLLRLAEVLSTEYPTGRDVDQYLDDTVIAYRNFSAFTEALDNDGWVRDDRGRKMYRLDTWPELFAKGALGAKTMEESQRQLVNRATVKSELELRNAKTRLVTSILDELRDHGRISDSLIKRIAESGVSIDSIKQAAAEREMEPQIRQLFNASKFSRPGVYERQQRGFNAFEE